MDKKWIPEKFESSIYSLWEKSGFFNPDNLPKTKNKKFVVAIPPPNITGSLHMGHALNATTQDIIVRYHRMKGDKTLWIPGTDHAGIATQNVVEKELAKQGTTRKDLGREKFLEKVWEWREKYGNLILSQFKKLGVSCDWSRNRFTLDKKYSQAVTTTFIHYYKKGYIYRGPRIVNWCPRCETAISDIEVKYQKEKTNLWYIKYPLKNPINSFTYITVATTRPETMLGDTAIAVNPKDKRYKDLIGEKVIVPLVNREIPIISHPLIDPEFGTGAVKITPAHDLTDWKIAKQCGLEAINVIGPKAKITEKGGKYNGLTVKQAREQIIEDLKKLNLLEKQEEYIHNLSICDRCHTPIEPQISLQWFVKMDKLSKPAIKVISKNKIKFLPKRYKRIALNWLKNIEDWCISRQLWWGHRLPVWFCLNGKDKNCFVVSPKKPEKCPKCQATEFKQSDDVLDTWFSSALWPFAALGWPEKTKDLKRFYPTNFVATAQDIIYLWIVRMIFSSLEFLKKIPFKTVYVHPTILNIEGKRMSKSLKTGVDPLGLIQEYGADATRLGLILNLSRETQAIRFNPSSLVGARNFTNKVYNISRFIALQQNKAPKEIKINYKKLSLADKWILSRLTKLIISTDKNIRKYELGRASREIYEFAWHEFADWYIEISKVQMKKEQLKEQTINVLYYVLENLLKLLHPFAPFVTEKIWQDIFKEKEPYLFIARWPKPIKKYVNNKAEKEFLKIKQKTSEEKSPSGKIDFSLFLKK